MIFLSWLINALTLLVVANLVEGFSVENLYTALIAAFVLGLVNATIRWLLIILTLPINVLTLGLFTFVINALMILLVSTIVKGFDVTGFTPALFAAFWLWLISFLTNWFLRAADTH